MMLPMPGQMSPASLRTCAACSRSDLVCNAPTAAASSKTRAGELESGPDTRCAETFWRTCSLSQNRHGTVFPTCVCTPHDHLCSLCLSFPPCGDEAACQAHVKCMRAASQLHGFLSLSGPSRPSFVYLSHPLSKYKEKSGLYQTLASYLTSQLQTEQDGGHKQDNTPPPMPQWNEGAVQHIQRLGNILKIHSLHQSAGTLRYLHTWKRFDWELGGCRILGC